MYRWCAACDDSLWTCCRCRMTLKPCVNVLEQSGQPKWLMRVHSWRMCRTRECFIWYLRRLEGSTVTGTYLTTIKKLCNLLSITFGIWTNIMPVMEILFNIRVQWFLFAVTICHECCFFKLVIHWLDHQWKLFVIVCETWKWKKKENY